jgi:hypothetical protein
LRLIFADLVEIGRIEAFFKNFDGCCGNESGRISAISWKKAQSGADMAGKPISIVITSYGYAERRGPIHRPVIQMEAVQERQHERGASQQTKTPSVNDGVLLKFANAVLDNLERVLGRQTVQPIPENDVGFQFILAQERIQFRLTFHHNSGQFHLFHVRFPFPVIVNG